MCFGRGRGSAHVSRDNGGPRLFLVVLLLASLLVVVLRAGTGTGTRTSCICTSATCYRGCSSADTCASIIIGTSTSRRSGTSTTNTSCRT